MDKMIKRFEEFNDNQLKFANDIWETINNNDEKIKRLEMVNVMVDIINEILVAKENGMEEIE